MKLLTRTAFSMVLFFALSFASIAVASGLPDTLDRLSGSVCRYDISFLWFDRVAEGELSFTAMETPGMYRAVLEARTLGVTAWLTGHRIHRYVSLMELLPDGRLRTLRHETHVLKRKGKRLKDRAKEYVYDYVKQQISYRPAINGQYGKVQHIPMGKTPLYDFLTVFCNFRLGNYGFPDVGETTVMAGFKRGRHAEIRVTALGDNPDYHPELVSKSSRLFQVNTGADILDTGSRKVFLWFDSLARPARVTVEGVVGIGVVRASLRDQKGPTEILAH